MISTKHVRQRMQQRAIAPEAIAFALDKGIKVYKQGKIFNMVLDKHITSPAEEGYRGLVVLTTHDQVVITAYKSRQAFKEVKKARKYDKFKIA